MSVPIATSPGRSGFGPQLSLSYDSGAGNGPFGFGWSLSLPQITRKTDKGLPRYLDTDESDVFILSGAEDLVPAFRNKANGEWELDAEGRHTIDEISRDGYRIRRYRPRLEGLFARIERWTNKAEPDDVHWRSISRDNILTIYGRDTNSRIADPEDPGRIFSWLICESRDDKGNALCYEYKPEDGIGVELSRAHERNRGDRNNLRRTANRYLKRIRYGNRLPLLDDAGRRPRWLTATQIQNAGWMFEVVFDYGEHDTNAPRPDDAGPWTYRDDPFSSYRAGFEVRTTRLCQRVLMFHHFPGEPGVGTDCLVRSTDFDYSYEQNPTDARNPIYSFLLSVTQPSYQRQNGGYLKRSLPPVEFEYSRPIVQDAVEEVEGESLENLPVGLGSAAYQWTDLHGEGIPGILTEQAGAWFYKRNLSPINMKPRNGVPHLEVKFAPVELVTARPNLALAAGAQFMDLAGDGQLDLVLLEGSMSGLFEHDDSEGWQPFRSLRSPLNRDIRDPNLKLVDLDGDGHADILITEYDALVWHPSLAEEGFGPACRVRQALDEEKGPRLVLADGTQSIYLADMSGDGLTDLVRIRNGEVCYWPNLGYGRFGGKVTMDHAPLFDTSDQFGHHRIRLADIDGSGTTDIIYLHREGVRLYFNQSGNSWSVPQVLRVFPRVDDLVNITATDLLGNGTACLVWSSALPDDAPRPMRYVNLMGSQKPHLLVKTVNNLGAETRVHYAPSTKFYLQDKCDGKPWITRLPFPVHVVERAETYDRISHNRFVARYAYHHGFFDGQEREFRGFGMVEQWDTEEFAALCEGDVLPEAANIEESSHVPPVLTRTWFHTGAYLEGRGISRQFETQYYRESDVSAGVGELTDEQRRTMLLDDTVLPDTVLLPGGVRQPFLLSAGEIREAARTLKGSILRQELYALDGTEAQDRPYSASERNYTLELLQPRGPNPHAVFLAHARETIDFQYERKLYNVDGRLGADPRVTHALTLAVDEYGNVLQSVAVGYGRRHADASLAADDQNKQHRSLMTCTENTYTNPVLGEDDYRAPLPCETRTYELLQLCPSSRLPLVTNLFRFGEMQQQVRAAGDGEHDLPYEDSGAAGVVADHPYRRLIEHLRTLYRRDDLTGPLPLGELHARAIPYESYKLALTPSLVAQVYGERVTESMLREEGRYASSEGDANGWIPSGQLFYSPDADDTATQELEQARRHFFLPRRFRNPFGATARVDYDDYDLSITRTTDSLANTVTAVNEYRVLQPRLMTDPNGNRSEVAFDALGMVVGTAVMGKPLPAPREGDSLDGFVANLAEAVVLNHLAAPLSTPQDLLGRATTRLVYDLFAYQRTRNDPQPQPAVVSTLARETHDSAPIPPSGLKIQHGFSYSDGFGREIQKKIQAEPGPVAEGGPEVSPRWVGSGWTIFNNKGKPVRQYEPFFSPTHAFQFARTEGVSPILCYDPVGRVVATLHPNHTYEKVVFDPWRQETWDVNDTVTQADPRADLDVADFFRRLPVEEYLPTWYAEGSASPPGTPERGAAEKAAVHADTPTTAYFDTLGRTFLTIAHNKLKRSGASDAEPPIQEFYATRVSFDIEGNRREVIDARDRIVMRYGYDLLGNRIHQASMEAGERWMLNDVSGQPIYAWDSRSHQFRTQYDSLRRPVRAYVQGDDPSRPDREILFGRTEYGEGQPDDAALNLRTRVFRQYDGAGLATNEEYDFKGNLLRASRKLAVDYRTTPDWSAAPALEPGEFITCTTYDALNRAVTLTTPDNTVIRPTYNEANLLECLQANLRGAEAVTRFVADIDYNAKGQRELIAYGNGVTTSYEYDRLTFRLTRLLTLRGTEPLQDLSYTYDPAGNITHIRDDAQQTIYFSNAVVEPHADYTYDALYRLIEATGREHIGQAEQPWSTWNDEGRVRLAHPHDGRAMRRYIEQYEYDEVGNFLQLIHQANTNGRWTRTYEYNEPSLIEPDRQNNRLSRTTVDGVTEIYTHDTHGNMTSMPHLAQMDWDFKDQLQRVDLGGGGTAYYVYDAAGQRTRKVIERQDGVRHKERIYVGGFEVYREYNGDGIAITLERETLHVMDDQQRIALVETRTQGDDGSLVQLIRFQLGNHLGSACLELDGAAQMISYEEYYPYGSSSYQAMRSQTETSKQYRYTGMERDEETGLNYHGDRYYASWLMRWISVDPEAARNLPWSPFCYAFANPTRFNDPSGRDPTPAQINNVRRRGTAATAQIDALQRVQQNLQQAVQTYERSHGRQAWPGAGERIALEAEARQGVRSSRQQLQQLWAVENLERDATSAIAEANRALGELRAALNELPPAVRQTVPIGGEGPRTSGQLAINVQTDLESQIRDLGGWFRTRRAPGPLPAGRPGIWTRMTNWFRGSSRSRGGSGQPPGLPPAEGSGAPPSLPPAGGSSGAPLAPAPGPQTVLLDPAPTPLGGGMGMLAEYMRRVLTEFLSGAVRVDMEARATYGEVLTMTDEDILELERQRESELGQEDIEFRQESNGAMEMEAAREGISADELTRRQQQALSESCQRYNCYRAGP